MMKIKIDFKIERKEEIYQQDLEKLAEKTLMILQEEKTSELNQKLTEVEQGIVEFGFLDDLEMQKLNKDYRQKDQTTDVLSFSFLEGERFPGDDLIGEIFISLKVAKKQAGENGWSLKEEVNFLFVHGLLHVLGFDHLVKEEFEEMFKWHEKIQPEVASTIAKIKAETFH